MQIKSIAIGCDHAGFDYKAPIIASLQAAGIEVLDFGTHSTASVDYPDFIHPAMQAIEEGKAELGIVICGSGNGVAITANKHQQIRCALCWEVTLASLARQHNNANVIAIPARFVSETLALDMVQTFITTDFEGGRHANRVNKIACQ
jgi:ribose 5-phosphate isomerase B